MQKLNDKIDHRNRGLNHRYQTIDVKATEIGYSVCLHFLHDSSVFECLRYLAVVVTQQALTIDV